MINNVVLVGRITTDPVVRMTQTGKTVTSFTLAVDRKIKKEGEATADFIRCTAWERTAEFIRQYVIKGTLLGIEGRIQTGSYDDDNGKKVYTTDIICNSVQALSKVDKKETDSGRYTDDGDVRPNDPEPGLGGKHDGFDTGPLLDIASDDLPF